MTINYDKLDPGIREHVRALRDLGYETTDSGDGVSKPDDYEGVLRFPHVVVQLGDDWTTGDVWALHDIAQRLFGPEGCAELSWVPGGPAIVLVMRPEVPR